MEWTSYVQVKVVFRFFSTDFNSCSTCFPLGVWPMGLASGVAIKVKLKMKLKISSFFSSENVSRTFVHC